MAWLKYTRGTIYPNNFWIPIRSHMELSEKMTGKPLADVLYIVIGEKMWWAWDEKKVRDIGENVLKICADPEKRNRHFKNINRISNQAISASKKVLSVNLNKCSDKKLINLYNYLYRESGPMHAQLNVEIDAIDVIFEKFLEDKLEKELNGRTTKEEMESLYKALSQPIHKSYISQEEIDVIKAALKENSEKDIKKITGKYWWIALGWENMEPYTEEDFRKKVMDYRKQKDLRQKLTQLENQPKVAKKKREELIRKYKLSDDIKYWLEVADIYTHYHDVRKEAQVRSIYAAHKIMLEIARRRDLNKDDLLWLWHGDVEKIFLGKKFDKNLVDERKKAIFVKITAKKLLIYGGKKALTEKEKYLPENFQKVSEIKGVIANKGLVRAKVKVCNGYKEALEKVKNGEILVCGMTTPDYVPAMKKAAAIVTDEGGITCHAAIISRELNIPCIVSTKIATSALHDGDLVEVDANSGVIKILKKSENGGK